MGCGMGLRREPVSSEACLALRTTFFCVGGCSWLWDALAWGGAAVAEGNTHVQGFRASLDGALSYLVRGRCPCHSRGLKLHNL